jgi:hypothetical protein
MTDQRPLILDDFAPLVGQIFVADCDPQPAQLKLVEASPLKDYGVVERPPFILVFYTSPEHLLMPGHYVMRCGRFGPASIQIGDMLPPPKAEAGYYYQAVFN